MNEICLNKKTHPATGSEQAMRRLIGVCSLARGRGQTRVRHERRTRRWLATRTARAPRYSSLALPAGPAHTLGTRLAQRRPRLFTPPEKYLTLPHPHN